MRKGDCFGMAWRLQALCRGYLQETTLENCSLLVENLDAVACALHHKDPVLIVNFSSIDRYAHED